MSSKPGSPGLSGGRTRTATLTAVLEPSSSEARLPPPSLDDMLSRLEERPLRCIMTLIGRWMAPPMGGDAGGDAMVSTGTAEPSTRLSCAQWCRDRAGGVGRVRVALALWSR
jgi:hypothetical protein